MSVLWLRYIWAVVVVEWSVCLPSTLTMWVHAPLKHTVYSVKSCVQWPKVFWHKMDVDILYWIVEQAWKRARACAREANAHRNQIENFNFGTPWRGKDISQGFVLKTIAYLVGRPKHLTQKAFWLVSRSVYHPSALNVLRQSGHKLRWPFTHFWMIKMYLKRGLC